MYKTKNHSKYSLKMHMVLSTKYRRDIFRNENIVNELKHKINEISKESNFFVEIMEVDKNHIHLLIDYEPNVSVVQIVRKIKQDTQNHLWNLFEEKLKHVYWKTEHKFWSKGYFVCSIGEAASYKTIQEYIKNQG